jgi:hypothetical protein
MMKKLSVVVLGLCIAGATSVAEARGWRWFRWGTSTPSNYSSGSQGVRSNSVEPGSAVRTPTRSGTKSNTPSYLLPKSDPRKHSTGF